MYWSTRMLEREGDTISWSTVMATEYSWQVSKWVLSDLFTRNIQEGGWMGRLISYLNVKLPHFLVSLSAQELASLWRIVVSGFTRLSKSFGAVSGNLGLNSALWVYLTYCMISCTLYREISKLHNSSFSAHGLNQRRATAQYSLICRELQMLTLVCRSVLFFCSPKPQHLMLYVCCLTWI